MARRPDDAARERDAAQASPGPLIAIDADSGCLRVAGIAFALDLDAEALPPAFRVGAPQPTGVCGRNVSCRFAEAWLSEDGHRVALSLRFDDGVWVCSFFVLWRADGERASLGAHQRWLRARLGAAQGQAAGCHWGVAVDRSGDWHGFVHNRQGVRRWGLG